MASAIGALIGAVSSVASVVSPVVSVISAISRVTGLFNTVASQDTNVAAISSPLQNVNIDTPETTAAEKAVEDKTTQLAETADVARAEQRRRLVFQQQAFGQKGSGGIGQQTGSLG